MNEEELEQEFEQVIQQNQLQKVNESLYLTKYQMDVLEQFQIPYQGCAEVKDVLFLLNDILDEDELDELEEVARELSERSYYQETYK